MDLPGLGEEMDRLIEPETKTRERWVSALVCSTASTVAAIPACATHTAAAKPTSKRCVPGERKNAAFGARGSSGIALGSPR